VFIEEGKPKVGEGLHGRFQGSGSRYRLTKITSLSVESVMAASAVGSRRDRVRETASSRFLVPEPVMFNLQQVLESVDHTLDSNDGEYERNDGQSEESEDTEENELGQHGDDKNHPSAWEAQRSIGCEFLTSQRSILPITPGNTQNSEWRIRYPRR